MQEKAIDLDFKHDLEIDYSVWDDSLQSLGTCTDNKKLGNCSIAMPLCGNPLHGAVVVAPFSSLAELEHQPSSGLMAHAIPKGAFHVSQFTGAIQI